MGNSVISIVTPVYNESENIPHFYQEISKIFRKISHPYELIFVDDGSADDSSHVVKSLKKVKQPDDNNVIRLITLSRNFGKEIATTAGIEAATGKAVIVLDADLQHPINKIPKFIEKWEDGCDVVVGVRATDGHDDPIKKLGSNMFYKIMNKISDTRIEPHSTDFRLLDRKVVSEFRKFTERERITRGLIDWLGYKRGYVRFKTRERLHGTPSYTTAKLFRLAFTSFTSHSLFPLKLTGYAGIFLMGFFGPLGLFTYIEVFLLKDPMGLQVTGTAMLGILVIFAIGIVLTSQGLMALYIANIHKEVSNRPLYVISEKKDI
jgi:dolichol-phosphate mannosyltransferase